MSTQERYDFIIIGSGTSGGIAAFRLQEAGAKCLLLEAGKHFTAKDFPLPEGTYTPQMFWGGGADFNSSYTMALLRGRCVGGGSIVNQALMDRFDDVAFDAWRSECGVDYFTEEAMAPLYDEAEGRITLQEIPEHHRNQNAQCFVQGMENLGYQWKPLLRAQKDCGTEEGNDCISCLGGCHRRSKQSTMETYIPRAQALGMDLESEVLVQRIDHRKDGVTVHATQHGGEISFEAGKAIVAAGSLGTTHLLLKSGLKDKLPALGKKFCMHPQFMNFAIFEDYVDSHRGALQGVKSLDPDFRRRGFKLENVFAPPIAISVLFGRTGRPLQDFMRKYRHFACIEVAIRDENAGEMDVDQRGKLLVKKELTDLDRKRKEDGLDTVRQLFESLHPKEVVQCDMGFGLHMMGGCAIGNDGKDAVVAPDFQVHDHPNLFVSDSSIFPNAPGINPALTVMALTHKMSAQLAGQQEAAATAAGA
jgi:choline dehydrogenase-like flavoprotein